MSIYPTTITGTWITSFNCWLQSSPDDIPLLFQWLNNRFYHWRATHQVDQAMEEYFTSASDDEKRFLSILNPVPSATLSCFKFEDDMTFTAWVRWNNLEGLQDPPAGFHGEYDHQWYDNYGVAGGTITVRNGDESIHTTMNYLTDGTEIRFIIAYKTVINDPAPSGAGTMRRVNLPPP